MVSIVRDGWRELWFFGGSLSSRVPQRMSKMLESQLSNIRFGVWNHGNTPRRDLFCVGIPSMATTPNFTCVICCGIITDASFIVNCGHEFCQRCILRWLNEEHNTCPICRGPASGGLRPCPLVRKIVTKMKSKHPNKDMDPNDEMEIVMEVINEEIEKEMYHLHLKYPSTSNNTAN